MNGVNPSYTRQNDADYERAMKAYGHEEVTTLEPGVSLTIPLGTVFQFRAGAQELRVVAVTVPPWPVDSPNEARFETGRW